jgi:hypothetical protein
MPELQPIFDALQPLLRRYQPPLVPKTDRPGAYDLWSIKELVIDGRRRKEVYFAALIVQKSYVGFYFMPVYAEPEMRQVFAPELLRLLKGKSCFHVRKLTPELIGQIDSALEAGFRLYQERGWI